MKKELTNEKSSQKVAKFLDKNGLHKKDFAEMIGVTLSYVYNLIDETIPFFEEYKIPQEPLLQDETIELLKSMLHEKKMSVINFLKAFPRKKRIDIVDMLRGAYPIPIDFKELQMIGKILDLDNNDIYNIWEDRIKQVLETNGMDLNNNAALLNSMFECARKYINLE